MTLRPVLRLALFAAVLGFCGIVTLLLGAPDEGRLLSALEARRSARAVTVVTGDGSVGHRGDLTDRLGEDTCAVITKHKAQPFFAYLAFNAVHAPLQAPDDEIAKFNTGNKDRDTLLAMGKRLDDAIGKIVATLKSEGLWENTLIFFISDNGGPLAQSADNTPLRGGKHSDFEGGIRVPFLVCWPAQLKPGEHTSPVISLDILPTTLAAAGASAADGKSFDGQNILPLLQGESTAQPRNLFWCSGSDEGWWAVRSGDWKLVGEKAKVSLFDLGKDVSEKNDLASQMPDKVAELTKLHDGWLAGMAKPVKAGEKRYDMAPASSENPKKKKKNKKAKEPA